MEPMIIACRYKTDEGECILENKACDGCEDVFPACYNPEEFLDEDELPPMPEAIRHDETCTVAK